MAHWADENTRLLYDYLCIWLNVFDALDSSLEIVNGIVRMLIQYLLSKVFNWHILVLNNEWRNSFVLTTVVGMVLAGFYVCLDVKFSLVLV